MSFEIPGPDEVRCALCQCVVRESATVLVRQRTTVAFEGQVLGMTTLPFKACPPCAKTNGTVVPVLPVIGATRQTSAKILQFRRKDD